MQDEPAAENDEPRGAIVDQPEPPWWKARKRKGARAVPISRDVIIDTAIRVLDAEGLDAVTVRRLAAELGTGPATLYWHIAGKDELGELIYDRIMGAVDMPTADPARWVEQVKEVARQSYRVMLSHNDAVRLSLGRIPLGPNMLRLIEWMLGLLRAAGIPDDVAVYFGDLLGRYIDASVLEERAQPSIAGKQATPEEVTAMMADYLSSLSPTEFPNVTSMAGAMFEPDSDARFEMGLDILLRGLAAYTADR